MTIAEKVRDHVKEQCQKDTNIFSMDAFDSHFVTVVKYAKELANKRNGDLEITELSAWLHDIGSIMGDPENHHITGANYAEKLLKTLNYPQDKIEKIKHCIVSHRGSQNIKRESIEAECLADADSMSHFDDIQGLFRLALVSKKMDTMTAKQFVYAKLERSWNKLSDEAKQIIRPKYEAVKVLFN